MATELRINGQQASYRDVKDFPVSINRKAESTEDITERGGDFTWNFKLPLDANNLRIFGDLSDPQTVDKFYTTQEFRADMIADGIPVIQNGRLRVKELGADFIMVFIVGSNIDFAAILKERTLRDITDTALPPIPFTGTQTQIDINADIDPTADPYLHSTFNDCAFPLVFYNPPFLPNRWNVGNLLTQHKYLPSDGSGFNADGVVTLTNGREIFGKQTWALGTNNNDGNFNLSFRNTPPAIYLRSVVRAIFQDAGYAVSGGWFDDNEVKKALLFYSGDRAPVWNWNYLSKSLVTSASATLTGLTSANATNEVVSGVGTVSFGNTNGNLLADVLDVEINNGFNLFYKPFAPAPVKESLYVAPIDGRYRFNVKVDGQTNSTGWNIYLVVVSVTKEDQGQIYLDAVTGGTSPNFNFGEKVIYSEQINPAGINVPLSLDTTFELGLTQNQFIYVAFAGVDNTVDPLIDCVGFETSLYTSIECISSTDELSLSQNLPLIPQADFIKDLFALGNLRFDVDENAKTIFLENQPNFYLNPALAVDLTNYVNEKTRLIQPNLSATQYEFTYTNDDDYLVLENGAIDNSRETFDNLTSYGKGRKKIEASVFGITQFDTFSLVDDLRTTPPLTFQDPEWTVLETFRAPFITTRDRYNVFQNESSTTGADYDFLIKLGKVKRKQVFASGNFIPYRYWDNTAPVGSRDVYLQNDTHIECVFEDTDPNTNNNRLWSLYWSGDNGLFKLNYQNYLYEIMRGHVYEIEALLTPAVFYSLSLRSVIRISNQLYRILEIEDYDPITYRPTKLKLFRPVL